MDTIATIFIIFLTVFIGFSFITFFRFFPKDTTFEKIPLAYGLGFGIVTFQLFLYSLIGIRWSLLAILLPWMIIAFLFIPKVRTFRIKPFFIPNDLLSKLLIAGIFAAVGFTLFEVLIRPLSAWDGWANWFLAGKAFFINKSIDYSYIHYANNSTPPYISLFISFAYLIYGHVNDQSSLLLFFFFYICLLIYFFNSLRKLLTLRQSLLFTFLLASLENVIRHAGRYDVGHVDLQLGFFIFVSSMLLLEALRNFSIKTIILTNIFLSLTVFVKTEGFPFLCIVQILLVWQLVKKRKLHLLPYSLISILLILPWYALSFTQHFPTNPFLTNNIQISRIPIVTLSMLKEFLYVIRWNFLWPVFFACLFFVQKNAAIRYLSAITVLQISVYFFIYLTTPLDPAIHITGSFDRLLLHITPLAMYITAILSVRMFKNSL